MTDLIANLDMYRWSENASVWDKFWERLHQRLGEAGISAPRKLTPTTDPWEIWQNPHLLLGHTCGWPYVSRLKDKVCLVGTFDFGLADCPPGFYRSVFIGSRELDIDPLTAATLLAGDLRIAVNGTDSQSGFRAFRSVLDGTALEQIPAQKLIKTGSHRNSIRTLAKGEADIAAIDAVTWALAVQYEPAVKDVRVLGYSDPVPGLPLITAQRDKEIQSLLFDAVAEVLANCNLCVSQQLFAKSVIRIGEEIYLSHLADQ